MKLFRIFALLIPLSGFASGALCEMQEVESFEYPTLKGDITRFDDVKSTVPSDETLSEFRTKYPALKEIILYCAYHPGPRFAQIDGVFFTLNGKSRRKGAYVVTPRGIQPVLEMGQPPSPLAEDYMLIIKLVDDAVKPCE